MVWNDGSGSIQPETTEGMEHQKAEFLPGAFCRDCSQLNLTVLFDDVSILKPKRRAVGSITRCEDTKRHCQFCKFLIQASELAYPRETHEAFWNDDSQQRVIYLVNDPEQRPWYRAVAIDIELPLVPYTWLQVGPSKSQSDRWVCVNVVPSAAHQCARTNMVPRLRRQEGKLEGKFDYQLLKDWLQICMNRHGRSCGKSTILERRFLKLYVIDLQTLSIKPAGSSDRYVALSYVWGSVSRNRYQGWNWDAPLDDSCHGIPLPPGLPRTVKDAIILTERLGERYLWVDAFCINQHDPQHRQEQINNMDLVYQCAYLTIIALDGSDADTGLAGISRDLRQISQPQVESYLGSLMATHLPAAWTTSSTPHWDRRAWTLQESLLSRRCVFLDHNQMTWKCQEEYFHDSMNIDCSEERALSLRSNEYFWDNCHSVDLSDIEWSFKTYSNFVSIYSGRQLTFASDILHACRGVLNHLTRNTGVDFFQGVPKNNFAASLLWKAHSQHCLKRRKGFSTWNWTGWLGRTEYTYWLHDIESFPNLTSEGEAKSRCKRARLEDANVSTLSIPEAVKIVTDLADENQYELKISSFIAKFQLKLVRQQGKTLNNLKSTTLQQKKAVGDQWTLLDWKGMPMQDTTGEYATFETTDHFFQVHPKISRLLQSQNCAANLLFVKFWPFIRDSEQSDNWQRNMVGALVLSKDEELGVFIRVASLVLPLSDWLKASPESAVVTIG